jgi:hypothetical protein
MRPVPSLPRSQLSTATLWNPLVALRALLLHEEFTGTDLEYHGSH